MRWAEHAVHDMLRNKYEILAKNLRGGNNMGDLCMDGRII
jgi:hypothetical protein